METLDESDILELKKEQITEMFEKLLVDTIMTVLHQLSEKRSHVICYKSDCPMRDHIPF